MLMYSSRISSFSSSCSIFSASSISLNLRRKRFSRVKETLRASCMVMVLAPGPSSPSASSDPISPNTSLVKEMKSIPLCWKKRLSSVSSNALMKSSGMSG